MKLVMRLFVSRLFRRRFMSFPGSAVMTGSSGCSMLASLVAGLLCFVAGLMTFAMRSGAIMLLRSRTMAMAFALAFGLHEVNSGNKKADKYQRCPQCGSARDIGFFSLYWMRHMLLKVFYKRGSKSSPF